MLLPAGESCRPARVVAAGAMAAACACGGGRTLWQPVWRPQRQPRQPAAAAGTGGATAFRGGGGGGRQDDAARCLQLGLPRRQQRGALWPAGAALAHSGPALAACQAVVVLASCQTGASCMPAAPACRRCWRWDSRRTSFSACGGCCMRRWKQRWSRWGGLLAAKRPRRPHHELLSTLCLLACLLCATRRAWTWRPARAGDPRAGFGLGWHPGCGAGAGACAAV